MKKGFTLIELLVVVLIIGILAAIALPMYNKAVMRSRFAALMPIAKAMADSNEAYYLEHGQYASNPQDLPVQGQSDYPEGTSVDLVSDEDYAYTMVYNEANLPDHNYLAFQKHSPKFAGTTMCEARDEEAGKVCLALGGTDLGGGVTNGWTAYLLSGDAAGSSFCPTGATCDEDGNVTECPSGKTLKEGKCSACDIANAASCSTTSYTATSCASGYCMKNGACVTCNYMGTSTCYGLYNTNCVGKTFGENAQCVGDCRNTSFSGESSCYLGYATYASCTNATFTENSTCTAGSTCYKSTFSGNATCDGTTMTTYCSGSDGVTTFTDNAKCIGRAACDGAIFSGHSICTSTYSSDGGCAFSYSGGASTFTDHAVCAGNGCRYANYEGEACCAGNSCPSGVRKCVYNSTTQTYDPAGYWD